MIIEICPKCGAELVNTAIYTCPPIPCKDCLSCGWHWEGEPDPIEYRPFEGNGLETLKDGKEIDVDQHPLRRGRVNMEYPCIYFEKDGKCQKFSDDTAISYCVMGPCPEQKISNADYIRSMSDEQMAKELIEMIMELCEDGIPSYDFALEWLRRKH